MTTEAGRRLYRERHGRTPSSDNREPRTTRPSGTAAGRAMFAARQGDHDAAAALQLPPEGDELPDNLDGFTREPA